MPTADELLELPVWQFETFHHSPAATNEIVAIVSDKTHKIRVFFDVEFTDFFERWVISLYV